MMNFEQLVKYFKNKKQDQNWYLELYSRPFDYTEEQLWAVLKEAAEDVGEELPINMVYEEGLMYLRKYVINAVTLEFWPVL